jgi:hypothetical protein
MVVVEAPPPAAAPPPPLLLPPGCSAPSAHVAEDSSCACRLPPAGRCLLSASSRRLSRAV